MEDAPPPYHPETVGYDQPGDGYTSKHATFGVDPSPPYQPRIPTTQTVPTQQLYPLQQQYANNTNINVVVNQPQAGTLVNRQRPPDYMCASVLACIFCFWPIAIIAIYYGVEAYVLAEAGDYEGARRMSDNAKKLMISSVFVGSIAIIFLFVFFMVILPNS